MRDLAPVKPLNFATIGPDPDSPEVRLASERLELLVEASRISTSQLDPAAATRAILWRSVPVLADCAFFDVIGADGSRGIGNRFVSGP